MNHNNNPNIPPLPKSSSGRRTTRLRGQTYPRPFDNNNNVNNNKHANINNTPTSSSNINNNNMSSSTKKNNNNNNKTATKNKYNKFTSPKRKRSESSVSHEERVRSAIRSSGYKHLNMNIDLRGSFDDLSLSNKGDLSPMSILNSEPPRSSRRVEIDGESPPFSARSDISNNSSNNDSSGSSFFAQSPNATISPQQQMSSTKSSSGIMSISSIPGINNDPLNILSGGRKRNNSSSRRRFRDSLFEQHINKSNSHKKNLTFTLRVEGIAAMPSKSKSARGYSTTNNNFNSNNNNSHHSSSKGPIRASKSSSMKKRSNRKYKYNNNGTNQEMFRSPRPVPPKIPTSTNKKNRNNNNNDNTMATDDDLHGLMNITPNYEQKKNDMSISSNGSLSGSLSARSLSSNSSIHSIRSVNSSTEKAFHYGDIMMDEDEFGTFNNNNNNHGVPPLPFHTPSKPVWRGPSPREDDDDEDEFKMSSLKKKSGLHINDLNDSVGSLGDDDLKPNSDNNVLYSSKVADVEDLNQSQDSFDGNNNNNNNMENNHLNNSFDSDHGYGTNNNNDVKDGNNLKASNNNNKVTPTGRPTPDMEAFDRKKSTPVREKGPQCPPTPVRTPSWQHNSSVGPGSPGGIERRNSLDGTKVLFAENDSFNSDVVAFDVDFENLGQLGSGAFSKVFKCRSVHDQKLYAIKKSRRPFRSKRDRARYLEEVETFQLLGPKCPHVLHYHKAWQEHGYFYIQSEYCARGNLKVFFDEIDESVMVPDIAIWGIIVDICAGLSHIHTHNLVHLDIKPQNIFITNDGTLKIGDFGMVREVGSSEDGHEGDNRYMAPELLDSSLKSPAADMFSFGIMMWEIMFNEPPPHDGEEWHNFRSDRVPRPNKSRSDELFSLICKLLSADPSKRPTSRQVLTIPRVQAAMQETNSFITSVPRKKKRPRFPHLQLGRSDSFVGSNAGFDPNEIARMREGLCTPKDQPVNRDW